MAEIRHLENRHDVIFFCPGWSDLDKISQAVAEWHATAMTWSKSKPDVEFQYGGRLGVFNGMSSQSHLSHCRVLPLGELTVMIPEPHATCHIAGWSYKAKSMTGGFRIVSDTLVKTCRHQYHCLSRCCTASCGGRRASTVCIQLLAHMSSHKNINAPGLDYHDSLWRTASKRLNTGGL